MNSVLGKFQVPVVQKMDYPHEQPWPWVNELVSPCKMCVSPGLIYLVVCEEMFGVTVLSFIVTDLIMVIILFFAFFHSPWSQDL